MTTPQEPESMVERIARAQWKRNCERYDDGPYFTWEELKERFPGEVADLLDSARAALEALKEPTEAMLLAGGDQVLSLDAVGRVPPDKWAARACFTAMIDAALSPPQSGDTE